MHILKIKPLSVNSVWRGKRFKTPAYSAYEKAVMGILPDMKLPEPPYEIHYEFGFSSSASDIDNPVKPITDILSKKYEFNDKLVKKMVLSKVKVKKNEEYVKFEIIHYNE